MKTFNEYFEERLLIENEIEAIIKATGELGKRFTYDPIRDTIKDITGRTFIGGVRDIIKSGTDGIKYIWEKLTNKDVSTAPSEIISKLGKGLVKTAVGGTLAVPDLALRTVGGLIPRKDD